MFCLKVGGTNDGNSVSEIALTSSVDSDLEDGKMRGNNCLKATQAIVEHVKKPIIGATTTNEFDYENELSRSVTADDSVIKPVMIDEHSAVSPSRPYVLEDTPRISAGTRAIPASIKAISGLDAELGLNRMNGRLTVYLRLLRLFAADQGDNVTQLRIHLSDGEFDEAGCLAHKLKGCSANLGATFVHRLASELEAAIMAGSDASDIEKLALNLQTKLIELSAAILNGLPEVAEVRCDGGFNWSLVREVLNKLESLLNESNIKSNSFFEIHAELLKKALGPQGALMEQAIDRFLYTEALSILKRTREIHSGTSSSIARVGVTPE